MHQQLPKPTTGRPCLRPAIPEISVAAMHLDDAVTAHLSNQPELAEGLIVRANMPAIREWVELLWGKDSSYVPHHVASCAPLAQGQSRDKLRMPSPEEKKLLLARDGYHCRFCGIPVIRAEVRNMLRKLYPFALPWGRTNATQHAAFQAMWAQYDHVRPYARGGKNDVENIVVTCAPCNFGRMNLTLEEAGLTDPRTREPVTSEWDGLERLLLQRYNKVSPPSIE